MAMTEGTKEMLYLQGLCADFGFANTSKHVVYVDNQGALALVKANANQHRRTKHIDVRYHFIRQQTRIRYDYIPSAENPADLLTKPLSTQLHQRCLPIVSLRGRDEIQAN